MQALRTSLLKTPSWKDWVYFGVRWLLIIILGFMVLVFRQFETANISDVLIAIAISSVANIILAIFAGVQQLHGLSRYMAIITDWIIVGVFIRVIGNQPQQVLAVLVIFVALGFMKQGAIEGFIEAIGIFIAGMIALVTLNSVEWISEAVEIYVPTALTILVLSIVGGMWIDFRDEIQTLVLKEELDYLKKQGTALADMRQRTQALSEMAMELNSTLRYDRILDAALSIGRISMRTDSRERIASAVLLYTYDNQLEIANSQGLSHVDEKRILPGRAGITAEALKEAHPVFGESGRKDPELRTMVSFQNSRSLLCIPLRAGFDNYGVLLYGSDARNAFSKDQVGSLRIIGTQVTIALQNAVLYQNLMEEKERIIELQEDARKDLVRDLHDVPTQTIAAVAMRLGIIPRMMERDPSKVVEEVEIIRNMTLRATEEIRHVMFKLRPLILESKGLSAALAQLANKMEQTYKQPMKTHVEKQVEQFLDVSQQGAIFYLIEEAANNARKYAEASMVRVSVTVQEDSIVVRIIDNGAGFDVDEVSGGYDERGSFGMVNMRERAELLDGVLELKSVPGKGTQVTAFIPVPRSKPVPKSIDDTASHIPRSKLSLATLEKS
jgi:signal transduction histidine kinase